MSTHISKNNFSLYTIISINCNKMSRVTYNTEKKIKTNSYTAILIYHLGEEKNVKDRKVVRIYLSAPELEDFLFLMTVVLYIFVWCLMKRLNEASCGDVGHSVISWKTVRMWGV
ncbi:hypothetical protein ACKWTF_010439 [Chironomus riparius]